MNTPKCDRVPNEGLSGVFPLNRIRLPNGRESGLEEERRVKFWQSSPRVLEYVAHLLRGAGPWGESGKEAFTRRVNCLEGIRFNPFAIQQCSIVSSESPLYFLTLTHENVIVTQLHSLCYNLV